ncbi:MAG: glycosyltransferase family 2 protein [Rhodanobacteraceae bacterium]
MTMRPLLSVIVPLAPDEAEWEGLRTQLVALLAGSEIIVVRPGTTNGHDTRTIATSMTTVCEIVAAPGRARQLNAGACAARGRWLWFLHADSRLHPRTLPALHAFLAHGEDVLGYFDLRYRADGPWLSRVNAIGANFRARHFGLPFGDQGFVIPAERFTKLGGYDECARYGEDHLLVWRARAAGLPLHRIGAPLLSSARKYAREGWLRTTAKHLVLTARQAWPQWRMARSQGGANSGNALRPRPLRSPSTAGGAAQKHDCRETGS